MHQCYYIWVYNILNKFKFACDAFVACHTMTCLRCCCAAVAVAAFAVFFGQRCSSSGSNGSVVESSRACCCALFPHTNTWTDLALFFLRSRGLLALLEHTCECARIGKSSYALATCTLSLSVCLCLTHLQSFARCAPHKKANGRKSHRRRCRRLF